MVKIFRCLPSLMLFSYMAIAWNPLPEIPVTQGLEAAERAVLIGTNRERARAGLKPLTLDSRLTAAARLHARDMSERDFFDHTSTKPGFETPTDRVQRAGSLDWGAGENIAFNEERAAIAGDRLFEQWLNSPPHRKNLLRPEYTHIGIGVYRDATGRSYGVQNFVARAFDLNLDVRASDLTLQTVELRARVNANLEVALFNGKEFIGNLELNEAGEFFTSLPFAPNQDWRVGSRPRGDKGAFLVTWTLSTPAWFQKGALNSRPQRGSVFTEASVTLEQRQQRSHILELRFSGNRQPVLVFERVGGSDRRVGVQNGAARVVCPVSTERRAVKLAVGAQTFTYTHRFVFDCQSGKVIPGAER
jgi:Cysteine-rich secretory protein family